MNRRSSRVKAGALALLVATSVLVAVEGSAAAEVQTLGAPAVPAVRGTPVESLARPADLTQGAGAVVPARVEWPRGSAVVQLRAMAAQGRSALEGPGLVRAGDLPVWVGSARAGELGVSSVSVAVRDRAKLPGLRDGLLLELRRTDGVSSDGRASVSVDYSGFAGAYGADWASRLRLVEVPACAMTTPEAVGCAPVELGSRNETARMRVSADVTIAGGSGAFVALMAGASGESGDFGVTSLQASSTWSAGGNSGAFTWQYPMRTPPSLGGPAPQIALGYSSSSVDGRSRATNNQPSWIGEGFEYVPGFIERRYKPCASDMGSGANNTTATGDLCWGTDNATMQLNTTGGELIRDDATGTWRLKNDDNIRIERLTNTVNGDNDNEYWKVTTPDGTQYFFGRHRLPGHTGSAPANKTTNSTWTVPVAGNHAGEPCRAASFTGSFCTQAWRWNLDYVVDVNGNTMSLFYVTETNKYGRNNTATDVQTYVRGGWLDRIEYGTDNRSGTDTVNTSTPAPMRVLFTPADRCLSGCSTHDAAHWPDTPWDQECTGSPCTGKFSPTFWTTKRLASVSTQVRTATAYKTVDTWAFAHTFPDPGDGTRAGLWLESITHTGQATGAAVIGGAVTLPEINFDWVQMPNRVDSTGDGEFPMNWMRLSTIWTETGGKIGIRYSAPQCVAGGLMPASPQTNTLRCYPVVKQEAGGGTSFDYFHKYVVTDVTETDLTGGSPDVVTSYEYVGTPAWRHTDDDGLTPANLRTWSDYRGYEQVNVRVGDPGSGTQTLTQTRYFRGMHGDLNGSGGTRTVTLPAVDGNRDGDTTDASDAPAVADENAFAGKVRTSTVFNGVTSTPVSSVINQPWQSTPTASRVTGATTVHARRTGVETTWQTQALAAGGSRVARTDTTFDSFGMPSRVYDRGDAATTGDEECIKTTYGRNTSANLLTPVAQIEHYALPCTSTPSSAADVIAESRTSFDNQAYGATPTKGLPTKSEVAKSWSGGGPVWLTQATMSYDSYGRPVDVTDVRGNHTTTAYTPATGGPVTSVASTTPLGTTTITIEPSWGTATAVVDVNNRRTEATVDALGRTRQVWLANRSKTSFPNSPNSSYTYLIRNSGGVNAVSSATLSAAASTTPHYTTTHTLYDGLLRVRQTQSASKSDGAVGTVFTETKYDTHGRPSSGSLYFDPAVTPGTTLFTIADWQSKTQTVTEYDRANREIASIFRTTGTELWRTTTSYGGDRIHVTPPAGGTATTTITDIKGRVVELRQYKNPANVGSNTPSHFDKATYHYNRKNQLDQVTDNAGNTWSYTYDLLGRQTTNNDPDKGTTTTTYNDFGDVLTVTDARAQTLAYSYDALGRRTGQYAGTVSEPNKLATWTYDPPAAKGQLASSSRWTDNGTVEYRSRILSYTSLYQPAAVQYVIPTALAGLSGTYTIQFGYKLDGSPDTISYPAAGGLAGEIVTYTYDPDTAQPDQLQTTLNGDGQYVFNTDYTAYGELGFLELKTNSSSWVQRALAYDDATRRLTQATTIRQTSPQSVSDTTYTQDPAGNLTRIATNPATGSADTQCFEYDYARRLTHAWTPSTGNCAATRSASALGGPAPYWHSWTFDPVGNRQSQTIHATSGNTTTNYTYPASGNPRPHALTSATTGSSTLNYAYDAAGNTTCRPNSTTANTCPPGSNSQTLTWNTEGRLATVTTPTGTNNYLYTAEGDRLVADDPTSTTLYLPGTEVRRTKSTGTVTATRYYHWAGQTVAMRTTGLALTWLIGDHQGTQAVAVNAGSQAITTRYQTPYGAPRGTAPSWPNAKGFVGGDKDPTGLTHIGARQYDPAVGRFISVDPLMDLGDPQHWLGYAYANHNPITFSDPTGLDPGGGYDCSYGCGSETWGISRPRSRPQLPGSIPGAEHQLEESRAAQAQAFLEGVTEDSPFCEMWHSECASARSMVQSGDWSATYATIYLHCLGYGRVGLLQECMANPFSNGDADIQDLLFILGFMPIIGDGADLASAVLYFVEGEIGEGMLSLLASLPVAGSVIVGFIRGAKRFCSFDGDTHVQMADGTTKPISEIEPGDTVLATNPETGETAPGEVLAVWVHDDQIYALSLADGSQIDTTEDHPFWNDTDERWQQAKDLDPGDQLLTSDGTTVTVTRFHWLSIHTTTAYNLTVADLHTYYVMAGDTPVLVHNDACETALFGNGGVRAPKAPSYRGTDAGTFKTRDEAWAAANRDKANYRYSSPREECSPRGCHVHLDVYNNQGQLLETRHYTYQQR